MWPSGGDCHPQPLSFRSAPGLWKVFNPRLTRGVSSRCGASRARVEAAQSSSTAVGWDTRILLGFLEACQAKQKAASPSSPAAIAGLIHGARHRVQLKRSSRPFPHSHSPVAQPRTRAGARPSPVLTHTRGTAGAAVSELPWKCPAGRSRPCSGGAGRLWGAAALPGSARNRSAVNSLGVCTSVALSRVSEERGTPSPSPVPGAELRGSQSGACTVLVCLSPAGALGPCSSRASRIWWHLRNGPGTTGRGRKRLSALSKLKIESFLYAEKSRSFKKNYSGLA